MHSDCPALDVVLSSSEVALSARGVRAEFRVPPLGGAANQAALVSQAMLGWVLSEYGDSLRGMGGAGGRGHPPSAQRIYERSSITVIVNCLPDLFSSVIW